MLRNIIITTIVAGLIAASNVAWAKSHKKCGGKLKILVEEVDLSEDQRELVHDIKEQAKENRKDRPRKNKEKWMIDYLNGEVDRDDVHDHIDERFETGKQHHVEMQDVVFDLLETYTEEQREQVLDNIEETKECHQQRKEHTQRTEQRPKKLEMLTKGLDLSRKQQKQLEAIKGQGKQDRQQFKSEHKAHKGALVEAFASGEINREGARNTIEDSSAAKQESTHKMVDQWADFLDGLSKEQTHQMQKNLEEFIENRPEKSWQR